MDKTKFAGLARLFGFQVNESDIEELSQNQDDMTYPDNWDEMDEEEQAKWKAKNMPAAKPPMPPKKNAAKTPCSQPASVRANAQDVDYSNLLMLNQMIDDIGGFGAFKALMLNAVDAVEMAQNSQEQERDVLVAAIVANSSSFEESDLEGMAVPVLRKLAAGLTQNAMRSNVDFRMMGARGMKANADADIAVAPAFLLANKEA